jgi:hypothetical protein
MSAGKLRQMKVVERAGVGAASRAAAHTHPEIIEAQVGAANRRLLAGVKADPQRLAANLAEWVQSLDRAQNERVPDPRAEHRAGAALVRQPGSSCRFRHAPQASRGSSRGWF